MLNFAKIRPSTAPLTRLRLHEGRAITNFANPSSGQVQGKGRLLSVGRVHFATRKGEMKESVGRIEWKPEKNQRVSRFVEGSNEHWQEEQECEDEILSSIGEGFI